VWTVDPVEATAGRPVGLAWFSPDCKHFSRAKGSRPVEKRIRGLAWVVIRWAKRAEPRVIMLENVPEFQDWGPLIPKRDKRGELVLGEDGSPKMIPDPARKGETFRMWLGQLRKLGYDVEFRCLRACDFGAPTSRKRFFLIARRDGRPIVWPEPTHGKGRLPYRTAAECIDWSIPCPSIFLSKEEARAIGVKRPLADKTMRRIALGFKRFVVDNPKPYIVQCNHGGGQFRGQGLNDPLATITQRHGYGLVYPSIAPYTIAQFGERTGQDPRAHSVDDPLPTITPRAGGGFPLISSYLSRYFGGERPVVGSSIDGPLPTITAVDHHAIVAA
ncbi:DNA cytosine methyltransferase, partial [Singulisphaera rosea]